MRRSGSSTHVVWLVAAVLASEIGIVGVLVRVAVLQPAESFVKCTSAEVESKVRLGANNLAPLQKLISSELVALLAKPSKFRSTMVNFVRTI